VLQFSFDVITALSYGEFEIIQLQRKEPAANCNVSARPD